MAKAERVATVVEAAAVALVVVAAVEVVAPRREELVGPGLLAFRVRPQESAATREALPGRAGLADPVAQPLAVGLAALGALVAPGLLVDMANPETMRPLTRRMADRHRRRLRFTRPRP